MTKCEILQGDALLRLADLPDESVQCVPTSPPYYGLRDYGVPGQIGHEESPGEYVAALVNVFREVRRVLRPDGVVWLNLGDCYAGSGRGGNPTEATSTLQGSQESQRASMIGRTMKRGSLLPAGYHEAARQAGQVGQVGRAWVPPPTGLKNKDLCGIPWSVAFALRADGWFLRSHIPWLKRNCMPESTKDRPTTAVESVFLLSKSETYFYDGDAVAVPASEAMKAEIEDGYDGQATKEYEGTGAQEPSDTKRRIIERARVKRATKNEQSGNRRYDGFNERWDRAEANGKHSRMPDQSAGKRITDSVATARLETGEHGACFGPTRNRRNSDWFFETWQGLVSGEEGEPLAFVVNPKGFKGAHFATWPAKLVEPMILAGSRPGDTILDPFGGSGTTAMVANALGRHAILIELNPEYIDIARQRTNQPGLILTP
jgi:DNA modification methylase